MRLSHLVLCCCLLLCGCGGSAAPSSSGGNGSSASADAALLGETFYLTIEDASDSLVDRGNYKISFYNGHYTAPGDAYWIDDSSGTFTAHIVVWKYYCKSQR